MTRSDDREHKDAGLEAKLDLLTPPAPSDMLRARVLRAQRRRRPRAAPRTGGLSRALGRLAGAAALLVLVAGALRFPVPHPDPSLSYQPPIYFDVGSATVLDGGPQTDAMGFSYSSARRFESILVTVSESGDGAVDDLPLH